MVLSVSWRRPVRPHGPTSTGTTRYQAPWKNSLGGKRFLNEPPGYRRLNIHVRVVGQTNQRYPLTFRDYLRAHPFSAQAYATLKRDLAHLVHDDYDRYAEVKDAACDLIYVAAEDWVQAVGWSVGPSDG